MRAPIGNRRPTIHVDVFAWYHVGLPSVYLRSRVYVRAHSMCRRRASVPGARSSERAAHTRKAPYIRSIYTRPMYTRAGRYIPHTWCEPLPLIPRSVMELRPSLLSLNKRTGHGPRRRRSHREEF